MNKHPFLALFPTPHSLFPLAIVTLLCLMGNVWALDNVPYLDESGVERAVDGVTVIEADGGARTLNTGWYLVRGTFTNNGTITINGTVHLILEDGSDLAVRGGSWSGVGINVSENSLTIYAQSTGDNMGKLAATGSSYGIGGYDGSTVTISGGTVTATGYEGIGKIGGGSSKFTLDGNAVVFASSVNAWGENRILKSGILFIFYIGTATILEGTPVTAHFPAEGMTAAWKNQGGKSGIAYESGDEASFIEVPGVTVIERNFIDNVSYIDTNGETQTASNVIVIDEDNISAIDNLNGWFLVRGNNLTRNATLRISGEAHIILEDGSDLAVTGSSNNAGIILEDGNSLSIYAQSTGNSMGKLTATGSSYGGIGGYGGISGYGGIITIAGGTVTAIGGIYGSGGTITISGGTVTATGNYGIYGSTVTISGGTVTATSGIGGGTFTLDGNAAVFANSVSATGENRILKSGILFILNIGTGTIFEGTPISASFPAEGVTAAWESLGGKSGIAYASGGSEGFIEVPSVSVIERDLIDNVPYISEDGEPKTKNDVALLDADNIAAIDNLSGWFLVSGNLTRNATLRVLSEAHIILEDGSSLTVTGSSGNAGINVSAGNSLSIYAQSTGNSMGKLSATGGRSGGAGIGGGDGGSGGTVTITGGTVTATGGGGAGIGGGSGGSGGTVTITGGIVAATGSTGIGGGYGGSGGTVTISGGTVIITGGTVTATGSGGGAGIGGGYRGNGGTVTISGGTVTATGGISGAGIGGGSGGSSGTVIISGGTVTATGGGNGGAGISSGGSGGTVTISGGTVTATSGIGGSTFTLDGNAAVFASSVSATGENRILTSGILFIFNIGTGTIFEGTPIAASFPAEGVTAAWESFGGKSGIAYASGGSEGFIEVPSVSVIERNLINNVPYISEDGEPETKNGVALLDAGNIAAIDYLSGWLLVSGNLTRSATLRISGEAHIILEDGSSLAATGSSSNAGINVSAGNSLSIYAQSTGNSMGKLSATGRSGGAGIGGGDGGSGGTVTIASGTVTATGGYSGAGIGGGQNGSGGTVTISGGTVTATGGSSGASIGGGNYGSGGTVTITGGTVTATGGSSGASIGGSGGTVTISGGTVTATGSISGTFTLDGNAAVFASNINATGEGRILKSGILFIANIGTGTIFEGTPVAVHFPTEGVTATWEYQGGKSGIAYAIDGREGFIEIPGVTVIERNLINNVPYIDENGNPQIANNVIVLDADNIAAVDYLNGWFLVSGNNLNRNATLSISGETHIILESGSYSKYGVISFTDNSLTIYAQSAGEDMGKLTATSISGGTIAISGGALTATSISGGTFTLDGNAAVFASSVSGNRILKSGILFIANIGTGTIFEGTPVAEHFPVEGVTAIWKNQGGKNGIAYEDGSKEGFIEIPGVTVIERNLISDVPYIDENGNPQIANNVTVLDAGNIAAIDYLSGWFLVSGNNLNRNATLRVLNEAHIILEDGSSLAVRGNSSGVGIDVSEGNSLSIYAQSTGNNMGKLSATGGSYGAGIGGGSGGSGSGGSGGTITISGGTVTATGSSGAGIGGGYYGNGGTVTISGGTVTATGGSNGAGIGGGYQGSGGTVTISGGTVTATGGSYGAGIGGGSGGSGGTITISGGTVTATGGSNGGAGSGGTVTITGGTVTATGNGNGAGIRGGTFTLNGNAVVFANSVSDNDESRRTGGILFINRYTGKVYGSVELQEDLKIESGYTLTIPKDATLTIPSGTTLTNNGTITPNDGSTIIINGTVNGENKIDGANAHPSIITKTSTSITFGGTADLLANTGQTIEYAISQTNNAPASGWQTETIFELAEKTTYWIFARSKENTHFSTGTVSALKPTPTIADLKFDIPTSHIYNGKAQGIGDVTGVAGIGAITVYYNGRPNQPTNAGKYAITVNIAEGTDFDMAEGIVLGEYEITAKPITITNVSATNRNINGTTAVALTGGSLVGIEAGDNVAFTLGTGTIVDASVGTDKTVTTNIILYGSGATNYTLTQPTNIKVNITPYTYTVTFKDHDGTEIETQTVHQGSAATAPTDLIREGYTFTGWDKAFSNVTSNLTVTALYTINTHTVTFKDYNGTTLKTQTVNHGAAATAPNNPTRAGYTFTGWNIAFSHVTSNLTITALYSEIGAPVTYTVTFLDHDGKILKTQVVNPGASATAPPNPSRTGYKFTGWDTAFSNITGHLSVTALYSIITYTVIFKDFDSTVLETEIVHHGSSANAPANPVRVGYKFTGWDKAFSNVTSNLTVTAVYEEITPILSHKIAGGNLLTPTQNGITLTANTNATVAVYNLSGKLISQQNYNAGSHSISLGHLPKGMYIVKASHGGGKEILRVAVR